MAIIHGNILDQLPLVEVQTPLHDALIDLVQSLSLFDPGVASSNLSVEAKGIYISLLAWKKTITKRSLTAAGVARICGIGRHRAGRYLTELVNYGCIEQSIELRRDSHGEMVERTVLSLLDSATMLPVLDRKAVSMELVLLDFSNYAREAGSWDIAILADFAHFHILTDKFPSAILADFAHYCILKGTPSSAILADLVHNHTLPEIVVPAPSPLFPPSSPPFLSPLDSPDLSPAPSPYSPPSSPQKEDGFFPEKETKEKEVSISEDSGVARSARDLPPVGQESAFAGRRPEGRALPVLVPERKKTKRVISTMVEEAGLLQQAKMDDLMEQVPEAAGASVSAHPTRDLIATYIEELGYSPPTMGKTLGAAKALTKIKEPCLPEELRQMYRFFKEQKFWQDKVLTLNFLAEHLIQWRMQGRPPAKAELLKAKLKEAELQRAEDDRKEQERFDQKRAKLVEKHGADSAQVAKHDKDVFLYLRDKHLYEEHGVTDDGEVY